MLLVHYSALPDYCVVLPLASLVSFFICFRVSALTIKFMGDNLIRFFWVVNHFLYYSAANILLQRPSC